MRSSGSPEERKEIAESYLRDKLSTGAYWLYVGLSFVFLLYGLSLGIYALADRYGRGEAVGFPAASLALALLACCLFACYLVLEAVYRKNHGPALALVFRFLILFSHLSLSLSSFLLFGCLEREGGPDPVLYPAILLIGILFLFASLVLAFFLIWKKENPDRYYRKVPPESEEGHDIAKKD